MMNLFGDKLEQGVLDQFGEVKPPQKNKADQEGMEANFGNILV